MYDVVIIGGGVIGCSIARSLSKYQLSTLLLEKENDFCQGTSKANSAIIHAGYDAAPGTLKGELNVKANLMFDELAKVLDFPFKRNGSLVLCFKEEDLPNLYALKTRGEKNGVPNLSILTGDEVRKMEPEITDSVIAALYAPTGGIVCPFTLTAALAENAYTNGVTFKFNTEVTSIKQIASAFEITTPQEIFLSKVLVNAAGLYSDFINNLLSKDKFKVVPRKGEYNLFDKTVGTLCKTTLFQVPTILGKGVLVTPTADGNLLIGPTAVDLYDKENLSTTRSGLDLVMHQARLSIRKIPTHAIITSFTGLRARTDRNDFIIGEAPDVPLFFNAAGIDSPGLTCAPLIGEMISELITEKLHPRLNPLFNPNRHGIPKFNEASLEEKKMLIKTNPLYAKVVCRCETITEAEILNALTRPLGAKDLDGVKRRAHAGSGRCQGGFCISYTMELLQKELGLLPTEVTKFGRHSNILLDLGKSNPVDKGEYNA